MKTGCHANVHRCIPTHIPNMCTKQPGSSLHDSPGLSHWRDTIELIHTSTIYIQFTIYHDDTITTGSIFEDVQKQVLLFLTTTWGVPGCRPKNHTLLPPWELRHSPGAI